MIGFIGTSVTSSLNHTQLQCYCYSTHFQYRCITAHVKSHTNSSSGHCCSLGTSQVLNSSRQVFKSSYLPTQVFISPSLHILSPSKWFTISVINLWHWPRTENTVPLLLRVVTVGVITWSPSRLSIGPLAAAYHRPHRKPLLSLFNNAIA
jgi:hypothetical protein